MAAVVAELAKITEEHPYLPRGGKTQKAVFGKAFWGAEKIRWILVWVVFVEICGVVGSSSLFFIFKKINLANWGRCTKFFPHIHPGKFSTFGTQSRGSLVPMLFRIARLGDF